MAEHTATYAGVAMGDKVLRVTTEIAPAGQVDVQTGVLQKEALLTDDSPNLTYVVRLWIYKRCDTMLALNKWLLTLADLKKGGPQLLVVTSAAGDTLTAEEAVLAGAIALPNSPETNACLANDLPLAFLTSVRPS